MITPDFFENALGALGTTVDEVAGTLLHLGIKGTHAANSCPISRYLDAQPVGDIEFGVASCMSDSYVWIADPDATDFYVKHPEPVAQFISRFDDGVYPHLEGK